MYESIIVSAYWFSEGQFWVVSVDAYTDNDSPDDPENLEADPNTLDNDKDDEAGVIEQLELLASLYTSDAEIVVIHINGNEIKAVTHGT